MTDVSDLIGLGEIADMAGVRKNVASNWLHRYEDFPSPVLQLKMGSLYNRDQVAEWMRSKNKILVEDLIHELSRRCGISVKIAEGVLAAINNLGYQIIVRRSGE